MGELQSNHIRGAGQGGGIGNQGQKKGIKINTLSKRGQSRKGTVRSENRDSMKSRGRELMIIPAQHVEK